MGYATYTRAISGVELIGLSCMEDLAFDFPIDTVNAIYTSCEGFNVVELTASSRLLRSSSNSGAFEVIIKRLGTVYLEYKIVERDSGPALQLIKCSAIYNPKVKPRASSHTV